MNIYSEELTDRIEIIGKEIDGRVYTGLRFYLELPVTIPEGRYDGMVVSKDQNRRGPFLHRPGDDDSAAVTFWGKQDLRTTLRKALAILDDFYGARESGAPPAVAARIANGLAK